MNKNLEYISFNNQKGSHYDHICAICDNDDLV